MTILLLLSTIVLGSIIIFGFMNLNYRLSKTWEILYTLQVTFEKMNGINRSNEETSELWNAIREKIGKK